MIAPILYLMRVLVSIIWSCHPVYEWACSLFCAHRQPEFSFQDSVFNNKGGTFEKSRKFKAVERGYTSSYIILKVVRREGIVRCL